ncbi:hypothetical protein V8B97DRAFT_236216 [Scleroderma yunnanense]
MAVSPLARLGAGFHDLQGREPIPLRSQTNVGMCEEPRVVPTISVSLPTDGDMSSANDFHRCDGFPLRCSTLDSPSGSRDREAAWQSDRRAYRPLYESFVSTRSRLVQIRKAPQVPFLSLVSMFEAMNQEYRCGSLPVVPPLSMWTTKDSGDPDCSWVMFRTHDDSMSHRKYASNKHFGTQAHSTRAALYNRVLNRIYRPLHFSRFHFHPSPSSPPSRSNWNPSKNSGGSRLVQSLCACHCPHPTSTDAHWLLQHPRSHTTSP